MRKPYSFDFSCCMSVTLLDDRHLPFAANLACAGHEKVTRMGPGRRAFHSPTPVLRHRFRAEHFPSPCPVFTRSSKPDSNLAHRRPDHATTDHRSSAAMLIRNGVQSGYRYHSQRTVHVMKHDAALHVNARASSRINIASGESRFPFQMLVNRYT